MAAFPNLSMSQQTRTRFSELVDQAPALGIDRDALAAAGPVALRALIALKRAVESDALNGRARYLRQVQDALRILEHRSHPELVRQFQTRVLALEGRGNDTEVAHVARGEIVVPTALQTEDVFAALRKAAEPYGIPVEMLSVGDAMNRINPSTGAPEFGVMDWISGLFTSDAAVQPPTSPSPHEPRETLETSIISNVNSPGAVPPNFKEFQFDPSGPGYWDAARNDPLGAAVAVGSAAEAKVRTALKYPDTGSRNNEADAYKHAIWNRRMAGILGPERARALAHAHEVAAPNSPEEHAMDLYNNRVARSLPLKDGAVEEVDEAFRKGYFRTTPFRTPRP